MIRIHPMVSEKFGNIKIAYIIGRRLTVVSTPPREKKLARAIENEIRNIYTTKSFENDIITRSWMELSKTINLGPNEIPSQIKLIRGIISGKNIPKINCIVDAGNIVAAKYRVPVGVFDLDQIVGEISLRLAEEGETIQPIGSKIDQVLKTFEIVYSDAKGVFSRYSTDCERTKVTTETKHVFAVIDGTPDTPLDHMKMAQLELSNILEDVCNGASTFENGITSADSSNLRLRDR